MILWIHRRMSFYLGDDCQSISMSNVMMFATDLQIVQQKNPLGIFYSHVHFTLLPPSPLGIVPRAQNILKGPQKCFLNVLLKSKDKK